MKTLFKILIVEDNPNHAELIETSLKRGLPQAQLSFVQTGKKALVSLQKKKFHLIVLDFHLPDFTGIEILQTLRKRGLGTPIVIITGRGDERTATESIQAGAVDYITKTRKSLELLPKTLLKILKESSESGSLQKKETKKENEHHLLLGFFQDLERMTQSLKVLYQGEPPKPKHRKKRELQKLSGIEKQMKNLKRLIGLFI